MRSRKIFSIQLQLKYPVFFWLWRSLVIDFFLTSYNNNINDLNKKQFRDINKGLLRDMFMVQNLIIHRI